jgi:hypothetical protein
VVVFNELRICSTDAFEGAWRTNSSKLRAVPIDNPTMHCNTFLANVACSCLMLSCMRLIALRRIFMMSVSDILCRTITLWRNNYHPHRLAQSEIRTYRQRLRRAATTCELWLKAAQCLDNPLSRTLNDGFSVVAAISWTHPFSTKGRKRSYLDRYNLGSAD